MILWTGLGSLSCRILFHSTQSHLLSVRSRGKEILTPPHYTVSHNLCKVTWYRDTPCSGAHGVSSFWVLFVLAIVIFLHYASSYCVHRFLGFVISFAILQHFSFNIVFRAWIALICLLFILFSEISLFNFVIGTGLPLANTRQKDVAYVFYNL